MAAPYGLSDATRITFALPAHWSPSGFWKSDFTDGIGSQARVTPAGSRISTRVVISNVRQVPGRGAKSFCWAPAGLTKPATRDEAATAESEAATRRKVRR